MGSIEAGQTPEDFSYETFSQQPFYKELNMELLRTAPDVHRMADFATGTGAVIGHMLELDKLKTPFTVIGIDIDEDGLQIARSKFSDYNPGQGNDEIAFAKRSVINSQIEDSSQELVTFFNSIHLIDDPAVAIAEAARVLMPGGTLLINTGYEKEFGYPDSEAQKQWTTLAALAKRILRKKYTKFEHPKNYFNNTVDDYSEWFEQANLEVHVVKPQEVEMDKEAMGAICSYEEFARGAFPNIPIEDSIRAFREAIDPAFERMKTETFKRGWYSFKVKKPY